MEDLSGRKSTASIIGVKKIVSPDSAKVGSQMRSFRTKS